MSFNMGGSDKSTNTNQVSNPWGPTQPFLQQLLGEMGGLNTGVSPTSQNALAQLESNAAGGNPWATSIGNAATSELGASAQPMMNTVNNAYGALQGQLGGLASPSSLNPMSNPYTAGALSTTNQDITNQINQEFAGSGRSGSPGNTQALARGLSQGESGVLMNQYNTNAANQMGAAGMLNNAGVNAATTNMGLLGSQYGINNMGAGTSQAALAAQNYGPNALLQLGQEGSMLPFQNLGMLASLLYPMAGLGGQMQGNSNTVGTQGGFGLNILSDERAKENAARVGEMDDGTTIYKYNYKGDPTTRVGPMAQEVEKRTPEAVDNNGPGGLKTVNMELATRKAAMIARQRLEARKEARAR
jgi:hypothetical protein